MITRLFLPLSLLLVVAVVARARQSGELPLDKKIARFAPTTITYQASLEQIIANGWAPQGAIDRYRLAELDSDSSADGPTFAAEAGRTLVEEFYHRLAEARHQHAADGRIDSLIQIYAALTQEASVGSVSVGTKKALAKAG